MSANKDDIAEHYNKLEKIDLRDRTNSLIINIRNMHNFIKCILIKTYINKDDIVLDLGCGRGGDLKKMAEAKIKHYVGLDFASVSIEEAKRRYLSLKSNFTAEFIVQDVYNKKFDLQKQFNAISAQFSFHYAFKNENTLTTAIENIQRHLKEGGYFICTIPNQDTLLRRYKNLGNNYGNKYYKIKFVMNFDEVAKMDKKIGVEYYFILNDAINNCIEYLVDKNLMVELFRRAGFKCILNKPFLLYFNDNWKKHVNLYIKLLMDKKLSIDEQKVVELYEIFVFQKIKK